MSRARLLVGLAAALLSPLVQAQISTPPDLSGAWAPYRGGRGADPALAPPPAGPVMLKPAFADAYRARRAAEAEAAKRGESIGTAAAQCTPYGMPRMMSVALYPVEIVQRPEQITMVAEAFSEVRRIYMNQPQLAVGEVAPGYYGHSVGRWEADTLVVDTIAIKESVPSYQSLPHSDQMRITERLRLVASDLLHDQITIEDPVVLEQPVVYTLAYRRTAGYKMVEFVCENNREYIDEKGVLRMRLKQ